MTSVKAFTQQTSIWQQCAPMLDQVVRWANTKQVSLGTAVDSSGSASRNALLAEMAFAASQHGYTRFQRSSTGMHIRNVATFLAGLPGGMPVGPNPLLTAVEWDEVGRLADVINRFIASLPAPTVFRPFTPGCGAVSGEPADLLAGDTLIEVKTVTRPFEPGDFRQVLTYAALLHASSLTIDYISLLNPRRAMYVTMSLDLVAELLRGEAGVVLLDELVESMTGLQVSA